jgi:hypothetical protein
MNKTAGDLINSALKRLGVIASGETPSSAESQDSLAAVQSLIETWSTNDILGFVETEDTLTLVPNQGAYTIGSGGDFNVARPIDILAAVVIESGNLELPLNMLKFEQWLNISDKTLKSNFPTDFYYRTEWPLGKLFFYPVPTEAKSIKVYSRKPIISLSALTDNIALPEGYYGALEYNLCLELADMFGVPVSAMIAQKADEKLSAIKAQNLSKNIPYARTEAALRGEAQNSGWTLADFLKGGG